MITPSTASVPCPATLPPRRKTRHCPEIEASRALRDIDAASFDLAPAHDPEAHPARAPRGPRDRGGRRRRPLPLLRRPRRALAGLAEAGPAARKRDRAASALPDARPVPDPDGDHLADQALCASSDRRRALGDGHGGLRGREGGRHRARRASLRAEPRQASLDRLVCPRLSRRHGGARPRARVPEDDALLADLRPRPAAASRGARPRQGARRRDPSPPRAALAPEGLAVEVATDRGAQSAASWRAPAWAPGFDQRIPLLTPLKSHHIVGCRGRWAPWKGGYRPMMTTISRRGRLVFALAGVLTLAMASMADARPGGRSGGSLGSRGSRTFESPAATPTSPSMTAPIQRS